jgi:acetylornithine deacetylase/succinyl-diaminopimelate desuccinylase-like protein
VPDQFTIYLDRRITSNEPREEVIAQIKGLIPDYLQEEIQVEELFYDAPSYTGFVYPVSKFYPAWLLEDEHPLTQIGQATIQALWGEQRTLGTWDFSTNGTYWAGKAGIPSVGFGPGDEKFAHTILEQVPLKEAVDATEFYALFPKLVAEKGSE